MTLKTHQIAALRHVYCHWQDRMADVRDAYDNPHIYPTNQEWIEVMSSLGELWDLPCRSGKTRAALTLIYHWEDWLKRWGVPQHLLEGWARPNLVLAPSDMVRDGAWVEDWKHVCPPWNTSIRLQTMKTVSPEKTRQTIASLKPFDTLVITYHTLRERTDIITQQPWSLVVADEVHTLKNPATNWTQDAYRINSVARLGLSATPFTNYVHELIHVLYWLQGYSTSTGRQSHIWPSVWKWENAHCGYTYVPPKRGLIWRKIKAGVNNPDHMYHWLRKEVMYSATPAEVSDAPEPNIRPIPIPLSGKQKSVYDQLARGMLTWATENGKTDSFDTEPALAQMMYLFQLCSDARQLRESICNKRGGGLLSYTDLTPGFLEDWELEDLNSKYKLVEWLVSSGEQVLVLTGFKHTARFIANDLGDKAAYITGDIGSWDRQKILHNFRQRNFQVIACTKAAWQGISLAAPHVVLLGFVDHVPGMVRQAIRRAWTMEDVLPVTVYDCYAPGTVEEWNRNRLAAKDQYATVLTGGKEPAVFQPVSLKQALRGG